MRFRELVEANGDNTDYQDRMPGGRQEVSKPFPMPRRADRMPRIITPLNLNDPKNPIMYNVYQSFINNGFSKNQALALTAEVGRENDFRPSLIFGSHTDPNPRNKKTNTGMFSWQGPRRPELLKALNNEGLIDENGNIIPSQASLDVMAAFARKEMETDPAYKPTAEKFLANPNIDRKTAAEVLGSNYIRWRINDPAYAHHKARRDAHYANIDDLVNSKEQSDVRPDLQTGAGGKYSQLIAPQLEKTHTVAKGDTLKKLSDRYGVSVDDIATASGLTNANKIQIGQTLVIPTAGGSVATPGGGSTSGQSSSSSSPNPTGSIDPAALSKFGQDNLAKGNTPSGIPNPSPTVYQPRGSTVPDKIQDRLPVSPLPEPAPLSFPPSTAPVPLPTMSNFNRVLKRIGATKDEFKTLANSESFINSLTDAMNAQQSRDAPSLQMTPDDVKSLLASSLKIPYGELFKTTPDSNNTDNIVGNWQKPSSDPTMQNDLDSLMNLDPVAPAGANAKSAVNPSAAGGLSAKADTTATVSPTGVKLKPSATGGSSAGVRTNATVSPTGVKLKPSAAGGLGAKADTTATVSPGINPSAASGLGAKADTTATVSPTGVKVNPSATGGLGARANVNTTVSPTGVKVNPSATDGALDQIGKFVIDQFGRSTKLFGRGSPETPTVTLRPPKEAQVAAELGNAGLSTLDLVNRFKKSLGLATNQTNYSPYGNEKTRPSTSPNTLDGFDLGQWGRDRIAAKAATKADQDAALADRLAQSDADAVNQMNFDQTFNNLSANTATDAGLKKWMTKEPAKVSPSAASGIGAGANANAALAPTGVKVSPSASTVSGSSANANAALAPSGVKVSPSASTSGASANANAAVSPTGVKLKPSASGSTKPPISYNVDTNSGLRNWLNNYGKNL